MLGGGKAWNNRGFFYWIYRVSDSVAQAKWLHSLIHKASINKSVLQAFSIFWLVIETFPSKDGIAKNMQDTLCKLTPREKCAEVSKLPGTLWFVINSGMFWRNFTTIRQIYIPYKFAQSRSIPPKIKCEILACKGS